MCTLAKDALQMEKKILRYILSLRQRHRQSDMNTQPAYMDLHAPQVISWRVVSVNITSIQVCVRVFVVYDCIPPPNNMCDGT